MAKKHLPVMVLVSPACSVAVSDAPSASGKDRRKAKIQEILMTRQFTVQSCGRAAARQDNSPANASTFGTTAGRVGQRVGCY
jgi:hypothetical protein